MGVGTQQMGRDGRGGTYIYLKKNNNNSNQHVKLLWVSYTCQGLKLNNSPVHCI